MATEVLTEGSDGMGAWGLRLWVSLLSTPPSSVGWEGGGRKKEGGGITEGEKGREGEGREGRGEERREEGGQGGASRVAMATPGAANSRRAQGRAAQVDSSDSAGRDSGGGGGGGDPGPAVLTAASPRAAPRSAMEKPVRCAPPRLRAPPGPRAHARLRRGRASGLCGVVTAGCSGCGARVECRGLGSGSASVNF